MVDANGFSTAILLVVFNRPATTEAVFQSIRSIRPRALYVAADGPRQDVEGEAQRCEDARSIATKVDWDCKVQTLFQANNLGCALGVSSAITWFFENEREGIVLEDDCLPSRSFYTFCQQLLNYYRENSRIMHIAGNSYQYGRRRGRASYYYSKYANIWGWASWQRAWKAYDFSLRPSWELRDTWDTQWQLSMQRCDGIAVVPNVNLVRNIGFGPGATHTATFERPAWLSAQEIKFPLVHPEHLEVDRAADTFTYYSHFRNVRHLRWIWLYRLLDYLFFRWKAVKRAVIKTARRVLNGEGP